MGDFLIDFRPESQRASFAKAADFLKFQDHVTLRTFQFTEFSLALSSVDNPEFWGPYITEDLLVAICGRIDLEESDWRSAELIIGEGGLAAKVVAQQYLKFGSSALSRLSGNFAAVVWDRKSCAAFLVGDLCGALPIFKCTLNSKPVFASHPDALAICVDENRNFDNVSLDEFVLTSCVTPPNTFYQNIQSLPEGTMVWVQLAAREFKEKKYFTLEFSGTPAVSEEALADELACNLISAVRKRTLPRLGPVAVALSGGLDSRAILAAVPDRSNTFAFCCFNEENAEFATAKAVAEALDVKLVPLTRSFDYYAENAELGIRIAGGMGTFANNHFLGMSRPLRELGAQNLLTGCYCDYMFKALPLNTSSAGLLRRERLARFDRQFYFDHYRMDLPAAATVRDRIDSRIPAELRNTRAPEKVFELEKLRTFPLFQEGDNEQRLIPQRVLFSYLPVADRAVLETYCKIPYEFKLNRSLFKKTVQRICGATVTSIPDANTGAPANATLLREAVSMTTRRVRRKLHKLKPSIANDTSWPDWSYYVANSTKLKGMWEEPVPAATEVFRRVLRPEDLRSSPADYKGRDIFLFVQMLSLKIWLKQRS
jgi:asparagine synthase (glutamine-hydrolysing)